MYPIYIIKSRVEIIKTICRSNFPFLHTIIRSLFLLVDLVANGTAPRITELSDRIFKVLILRLSLSEVLIEFNVCKFEKEKRTIRSKAIHSSAYLTDD